MGLDHIIITVMSGADDGKIFELDKTPVMLGRHADDNICLPFDTRTSRHHARISKEGKSYFIEDVGPEGRGSTNGTYIEGSDEKITAKTSISSSDLILLGNVWIKFETT